MISAIRFKSVWHAFICFARSTSSCGLQTTEQTVQQPVHCKQIAYGANTSTKISETDAPYWNVLGFRGLFTSFAKTMVVGSLTVTNTT